MSNTNTIICVQSKAPAQDIRSRFRGRRKRAFMNHELLQGPSMFRGAFFVPDEMARQNRMWV